MGTLRSARHSFERHLLSVYLSVDLHVCRVLSTAIPLNLAESIYEQAPR